MSTQTTTCPSDRIDFWTTPSRPYRYNCPVCTESHFSSKEHQLAHLNETHPTSRLLDQLAEDLFRLNFDHPLVSIAAMELVDQLNNCQCPVCKTVADDWPTLSAHVTNHSTQTLYDTLRPAIPDCLDKAPEYTALGYSPPAGPLLELVPGDHLHLTVTNWTTKPASLPAPVDGTGPWTLTARVETVQYDFRQVCRPYLAPVFETPDTSLPDLSNRGLDIFRKVYLAGRIDSSDDTGPVTPWTLVVDAPADAATAMPETAPPAVTLQRGVVTNGELYPDADVRIVDATIAGVDRTPWTTTHSDCDDHPDQSP